MKEKSLLKLFKPYKVSKKRFIDFLDSNQKRNFFKHRLWFECSKSLNESCINNKCRYNYVNSHDDALYLELMQEIKAEKLAMEKRTGGVE